MYAFLLKQRFLLHLCCCSGEQRCVVLKNMLSCVLLILMRGLRSRFLIWNKASSILAVNDFVLRFTFYVIIQKQRADFRNLIIYIRPAICLLFAIRVLFLFW